MEGDVCTARSGMDVADLQEVLGGTFCLDNRNYIVISRDLLYGCLSTAAVMVSLLAGV
jgi:hypothetical protein